MIEPSALDKIRKAFALALHPGTGAAEQKAAWIGALRLCVAQGFKTLDEFLDGVVEPVEEEEEVAPDGWYYVMPFGKHKGQELGIIALHYPDYLDWLAGQKLSSKRLREAVAEVIYWRGSRGAH